MNLSPLAVPDHFIIVGVFSHLVELIELLLLVVIADSCDYSADDNSQQNGNTIHPEELPLLACEILHHDGHNCSYHQDYQHLVGNSVAENLIQ